MINLGCSRHGEYIYYVMTAEEVVQSEIFDFTTHLLSTTALFICRLSGLTFYHRLCSHYPRFNLAMKILIGIFIAIFLPQTALIIFHCHPVTPLWPYPFEPNFYDYTCLRWWMVFGVNAILSLICDAGLYFIPISILCVLSIPKKRKIQLACIILPGSLVIIISSYRLHLIVASNIPDSQWLYGPTLTVQMAEIGATLISLSMPGLKPLFDKYIKKGVSGSSQSVWSNLRGSAMHASSLEQGSVSLVTRHTQYHMGGGAAANSSGDELELVCQRNGSRSLASTEEILNHVEFSVKEEPGRLGRDEK
ncbi:hypothetical protein B0J13DRAFT_553040 [Dactylonectria estremocensis]|uniref:Rhodopsin domain-containing protein n=1 Tax=Dactylonectria estremocensis TaxID=1079267 RepID=A0A9P9EXX3_9HYPO|nr:hypothetical protein B0J13DRAFT_553040 [Dactylonectria estremocensis]